MKKNCIEGSLKRCLFLAGLSSGEVSLLLTNNSEIKKLNALYRHQNKPTDCLSFPLYEAFEARILASGKKGRRLRSLVLGDIVISVPFAKREAKRLGISLEREFLWLLVHSFLHLLGFDHQKTRETQKMQRLEKIYLEDLGVS